MASRFTLDKEEETKTPEPSPFTAIPQALFKTRTVLIFGEVDMKMAERVTANLLALCADDPNKDIKESSTRLAATLNQATRSTTSSSRCVRA